jgi:hypothetical protein
MISSSFEKARYYILMIAALFAYSCSNPGGGPEPGVPPVPGGSGVITTQYPHDTSQPINWTAASDAVDTDPTVLQYRVIRSTNSDIGTLQAIEGGNGTVIMDWAANTTTFPDSTITGGTNYWYNVLVKDLNNNIAAYTMANLPAPLSPSAVFVFSPGDTLAQHGFTGVNLMEPITSPDGYILTTTAGLNPPNGYTSSFTTPQFSDMDRNANSGKGFSVIWKVKYLATVNTNYSSANEIQVKLLDSNGAVLYKIGWDPIPDGSNSSPNRFLYVSDSSLLVYNKEQWIFPSGLNSPDPAWVSFRLDVTSTGLSARDDLTADYTTSNGNPDWTTISPQISLADTTNNHIAKIMFQYQHLGDYSVLVKDFSISQNP